MSAARELKAQLEAAELQVGYLRRQIARMEKRLLRQEKLDDMNRHQTRWAMQQLEQARVQAEQANRAKTDFLATISHEIRTPLNIVLGMGELLAGTGLDRTQQQYLQSLRLSGEHLLKLIDDILEFSRIESGTVEVERAAFDLGELLDQMETMGTHLAAGKGIGFRVDRGPALARHRLGDSRKIKQVLLNLLGNAVKFTDRGQVVLALAEVAEEGRETVRFTVADTGIGIEAEMQETIFQRFTQIDQAGLRGTSGVGLGLAICRRLAEAMGGSIGVDSQVGRGSTFSVQIELPISGDDPVVRGSATEAERDEALAPMHVLVIDDISLNFDVIRNFLKDLPVRLDYGADGRQALRALDGGRYDLILMDLRMPVMDGAEAARLIRLREKESGGEPTPIIAMTAHAFIEKEKEYPASGFNAVLSKPFSRSDLVGVLRRHARPRPVARPETGPSGRAAGAGGMSPVLAPLIPVVLDSIAGEIEVIRKALDENDGATLATTSHAIKGLAGMYGLARLSELLDHLEKSAVRREHRTTRALAEALASHVSELRQRAGDQAEEAVR